MTRLDDMRKTENLQRLVDTLIDVGEGYDVMLSRGDADLRKHVKPIADLHAEHLVALKDAMSARGDAPDTSGTAMGAVHKTVVSFRDMIGGLDDDVLDAVQRGEQRVLSAYDDALEDLRQDDPTSDLIAKQRQALSKEIKALDAAA
ncbi:PA2169 family four-helix-bundle protein [Marivita sp. S6314]|uniref:DUF2383 domain-containing protein n=1 Tax=Marivita sp. S6314 TaxID=2926406 RepID=UPI001FF2F4CD|nr:DUF2383 domain-containing protein [Marivita sp. S6314]MCK0149511.1 PA2169 family four-helix-bundle protein [Marivita sp. S6314]